MQQLAARMLQINISLQNRYAILKRILMCSEKELARGRQASLGVLI